MPIASATANAHRARSIPVSPFLFVVVVRTISPRGPSAPVSCCHPARIAPGDAPFTIWTLTTSCALALKSADSRVYGADEAGRVPPRDPHLSRRSMATAKCGGASGMPEAIRITGGGFGARPRQGGFRTAVAAVLGPSAVASIAIPAAADDAPLRGTAFESSTLDAYLTAFAQLDRHEIAAIALTFGILCFAVVTAIMLVRTRARLAESVAAAHDEIMAARAEADRTNALLRSDPQVLVAWAAAADEP